MYQPRIPIGGGGRVIDLTEDPRGAPNPIADAINLIFQRKRQREQDELARRKTEAEITQMEQPEAMQGQIVTEGGKTWLVDKRTGKKIDLGIKSSPKVEELLKLIEVGRKYETPTEAEKAISGSAEEELLGLRGFEEYEEEYTHDPWWGKPRIKTRKGIRKKRAELEAPSVEDWQLQGMLTPEMRKRPPSPITEALGEPTVGRKRKRVVSKAVTKERPPKPKEYPDAVWNEEHQMWTIVKNGRLMGVK